MKNLKNFYPIKKLVKDISKSLEKDIQKTTDDNITSIDKISADKEKEILQIWTSSSTLRS